MEVEFELSQELLGHEKAARCICALNDGRIATGGVDGLVVVWKAEEQEGKLVWNKEKVLEHHNDFIFCLSPASDSGCFYTGSKDRLAYRIDQEGNPVMEFKGHEGAVSSITERGAELLSGSWDGTLRIWDVATGAEKQKIQAGTHAVTVCCLPTGEVVTGSQDKEIKFWRGQDMVRNIPAHGDIVRRVTVASTALASCSNDQAVKLWTLDGLETATLAGHESFVFDVCFSQDRKMLFSGGDDRLLIIWKLDGPGGQMSQNILHSNTVWGVINLPSGDVVTACADGVVRVWTQDPDRMAAEDVREAFRSASQAAAAEASAQSKGAVSLAGVADVSTMASTPGKKEGEIKMFKDGTIVNAYAWKNGTWDLIGQVTGRPKQAYPGDQYFTAGEYDYIFDVEVGKGGEMVKLPMNEDDNHMVAAEKFCAREGIDKVMYLEQIMSFIRQNLQAAGGGPTLGGSSQSSGGYGNAAPKAPEPEPPKPKASYRGKALPARQPALFKDGKFDPLLGKIQEINGGFPDDDEKKIDPTEFMHLNEAVGTLKSNNFGKNFRACERDLIWQKMDKWPQESMFPVVDLRRLYLIHPDSSTLFKGTDKGARIIANHVRMLQADTNGALGLCASRFLANLFASSTNKWAVYDKRKWIFEQLTELIPKVTNKNVKIAIASTLMNFSVAYTEKSETNAEGKEELLRAAGAIVGASGEAPDAQIRGLLAAGTIMVCKGSPDPALKDAAKAALTDPLAKISDPKIGEIAAEVKALL